MGRQVVIATLAFTLNSEVDAAHRAIIVDVDRQRREPFGKTNTLLQCFLNLFVIQGVRRAIDHAASIGDGGTAPALQQFDDARRTILCGRHRMFDADSPRMRQKLFGDFALFRAPRFAHRVFALFLCERLVALQKFLCLNRVIGQRFGGGIDCGQAAANHHHWQAYLHVGNRIRFCRAGQLQCHQKVGRGAHAAREAIGNIQHRRFARTHRERDVIETHREGIVGRQRATKAHAAE